MAQPPRSGQQGAERFPAFAPFANLDAVRNAPRQSATVTIGGQMYREVDTGRANVLVPYDPLYLEEERAAQREGIVRALFMADHPLGTVAYAAASLAGAPQKTRDAILSGVGLVEGAAIGARSPKAVRLRLPAPQIKTPRDPLRERELNERGQAMGFDASMTRDMLVGGTRAKQSIKPPGFMDGDARGHLRAKQLGGRGDDERNLVALTQRPTNSPQMSRFESEVARRVRAGEAVEYMVRPLYREGALPPSELLLTATGPRQSPKALVIRNPAGYRR